MISVILLAILCLLVAFVLYRRKKLHDSLPPGPPSWPLVGNLLQIDDKDPRQTFYKWHKKYGPLFTVWFGPTPQIFVTDYEAMQEIFIRNGDTICDKSFTFLELMLQGPYGIFLSSGEMMQEQRRFAMQLLRHFGMGKRIMEENIKTEAEKMVHAIENEMNNTLDKVFDVTKFFRLPVVNVISSLMVGRVFDSDDDPKVHKIEEINRDFDKLHGLIYLVLQMFPWLRYVPLFGHFGYDELDRQRQNSFDLIDGEVEERRKTLKEKDEVTDFTEAYIKEMDRRKQTSEGMGYFSEWQMTCVIWDIWNAGFDTTLTTMKWMSLLMMRFPEVQRKVHQEIDEVVGRERLPDTTDKAQMPYTNATLLEIQRYGNILTFHTGRVAKSTLSVAGCVIPEGASVVPYVPTVMMDENVFEKPNQFIPERFLEHDGKTLKKNLCDRVLPFSLGKRNCIGEGLAKMELFLFFAALLQKFTFSCPPNEPEPTLTPLIEIFVRPQAYKCQVSSRY